MLSKISTVEDFEVSKPYPTHSDHNSFLIAAKRTEHIVEELEKECALLAISQFLCKKKLGDKKVKKLMPYFGIINNFALMYDRIPLGIIKREFNCEGITVKFITNNRKIVDIFGRYPVSKTSKNLKDWF